MKQFFAILGSALLLLTPTTKFAFAKDEMQIKWTSKVGETIKFISVNQGKPDSISRSVEFTYESLKRCPIKLYVFGEIYTKDNVQSGTVRLKKFDVVVGGKFRDTDIVPYEQGNYIVFNDVICE